MNFPAIYHRANLNYCYALNQNELNISIQTGYDVRKVILCYNDPFTSHGLGANNEIDPIEIEMTDKLERHHTILWSVTVKPPYKRIAYYFHLSSYNELSGEEENYYFLEDDFYTEKELKEYNGRRPYFHFPWINSADIITPPSWVKDTIWYQIFVDRFCNGNPSINEEHTLPWNNAEKIKNYNGFYGGDLAGITKKLPYLNNLGITGIYLTPICESKSNHKYDTTDYKKIDMHFGTDQDMKEMVKSAHHLGIRVMMDGVFNHSGSLFKPWKDVVENGPASKYYDWFIINKWPFETGSWCINSFKANYYSFGFFDFMPKLNTSNDEVINYIVDICLNWIKEYDIDGLRLDVAGEISHKLCKQLHSSLKKQKTDFFILGEIWHDSSAWLLGDEFDSVMNYSFSECIEDYFVNTKKTAKDFEYSINRCYSLYPRQVNDILFNLLDSHDTMRLITKLHNINHFYQQLAILFFMPGSVCIYYGTEIALEGENDPDCRRCMPWSQIDNSEFDDRILFMKSLISLRKQQHLLTNGKYKFNSSSKNDRILYITRYDNDTDNSIHLILNCSNNGFIVTDNIQTTYISNLFEKQTILPGGFIIFS